LVDINHQILSLDLMFGGWIGMTILGSFFFLQTEFITFSTSLLFQ